MEQFIVCAHQGAKVMQLHIHHGLGKLDNEFAMDGSVRYEFIIMKLRRIFIKLFNCTRN